jgi:Tol biopolymer transport system component
VLDPTLGTRDLWMLDVVRGLRERFTFDPGDDFGPNWSRPAGDRIVFSSRRGGSIDLYEKGASGGGSEQLLLADEFGKFNPRYSADGRYVAYVAGGGIISRSDVFILPLFGDRKPAPFLSTSFIETHPQMSPDGRWLAYSSNESGQLEVYVTTFPGKGGKWRVSAAGGGWPRWHPGGNEIVYQAPNNQLVAASVTAGTGGIQVGTAHALFTMRPRPAARLDAYAYDITSDGQRFIVNTLVSEPTAGALTLVVNWTAALNR